MIAFFDSGYGGLTIFSEVRKLMPSYDYVYLGDNARAPYGTRSFDVVYRFTLEAVSRLLAMGAELVILACNTASAKALRTIQMNDLPRLDPSGRKRVLGIIRPSIEVLGSYTRSKHVGIMATPGTVASQSYIIEMSHKWSQVSVFQQSCPMWVPIVENGEYNSLGADYFVKKYVDELMIQSDKIDTIMLACTHFPLLLPKIKQYLPTEVEILSQGVIVANSLQDYLVRHGDLEKRLGRSGEVKFFTTESPDKFVDTAGLFFSGQIDVKRLE